MKKEDIQKCMDLMANAISIVNSFPMDISFIAAIKDQNDIKAEEWERLEGRWRRDDLKTFLSYLDNSIKAIKRRINARGFVRAYAICLWIDEKINYTQIVTGQLCLRDLIFPTENEVVEIDSMNSNYKRTRVLIVPKLKTVELYSFQEENCFDETDMEENKGRPFSNRDAFHGLNSRLKKVSVLTYDEKVHIHNIILHEKRFKHDDRMIISCCPMGDSVHPIIEKKQFDLYGMPFEGEILKGFENSENLERRFQNDWACLASCADILLFPEGLGTDNIYSAVSHCGVEYCQTIRDLCRRRKAQIERSPLLTVLPSYWSDGQNVSGIVFYNARIICKQKKYYPYVNIKKGVIEALQDGNETEYYIVHVRPYYRVAVVICSEFLAICNGKMDSPLFKEAGVSLVLVPSFSPGEHDFLNAVSSLKCFGVTAVWLNSCGVYNDSAFREKTRVFGAASIAGMNKTMTFRGVSTCNASCNDYTACGFLVSLPNKMVDNRTISDELNTIKHMTCFDKKE